MTDIEALKKDVANLRKGLLLAHEAMEVTIKLVLKHNAAIKVWTGTPAQANTSSPLPCPFCGEKPTVENHPKWGWGCVECQNPKCTENPSIRYSKHDFRDDEGYKAHAVENWNRTMIQQANTWTTATGTILEFNDGTGNNT